MAGMPAPPPLLGHPAPARSLDWFVRRDRRRQERNGTLLYGSVALGVLAGVAISAYWWRRHTHALNLLQASPFDRVEELITSCEKKIEDIERAIEELKEAAL